jgi:uncharacterized membrane protein YkoI
MILLAVMLCAAATAQRGKKKAERSSSAKAGEVERKVTEAEVPATALATLKKLAAGAKITEFAEEIEHGHTFYEGSWKSHSGAKMDVLVTQTGDLVEIEERISTDQVPAAVLKVVRKAAGKDAQLSFEKKTMILYEVKFRKGDRRHELLLTPDGRRVEEEVEKGKTEDDDEGEDEEQVSINEVPRAVKATILKHAKGGEIKKIEREDEDGKVIYEAEVAIGGKEVELKVAPDGKLVGKEVEDEGDEGDDDDDDDD